MNFAVRPREFWSAVVILVLSIAFLVWAETYPSDSRTVPALVAWATIVLSVIDICSQFETSLGRRIRALVTADKIIQWKMEGDEEAPLTRVLLSLGWVAGYLVALFVIGFILATPIYVFSYMLLHGHHRVRNSALTAAAVTLTIWLVFVVLFRYPLYPGLLFEGF